MDETKYATEEWLKQNGFALIDPDWDFWRKRDISTQGRMVSLKVSNGEDRTTIKDRWFKLAGWRLT